MDNEWLLVLSSLASNYLNNQATDRALDAQTGMSEEALALQRNALQASIMQNWPAYVSQLTSTNALREMEGLAPVEIPDMASILELFGGGGGAGSPGATASPGENYAPPGSQDSPHTPGSAGPAGNTSPNSNLNQLQMRDLHNTVSGPGSTTYSSTPPDVRGEADMGDAGEGAMYGSILGPAGMAAGAALAYALGGESRPGQAAPYGGPGVHNIYGPQLNMPPVGAPNTMPTDINAEGAPTTSGSVGRPSNPTTPTTGNSTTGGSSSSGGGNQSLWDKLHRIKRD